MANVPVTLNIPEEAMPTVIDAFAAQAGWDQMDPETRPDKGTVAWLALVDYVVAVTKQWYGQQAAQTARADAEALVDAVLVIT